MCGSTTRKHSHHVTHEVVREEAEPLRKVDRLAFVLAEVLNQLMYTALDCGRELLDAVRAERAIPGLSASGMLGGVPDADHREDGSVQRAPCPSCARRTIVSGNRIGLGKLPDTRTWSLSEALRAHEWLHA